MSQTQDVAGDYWQSSLFAALTAEMPDEITATIQHQRQGLARCGAELAVGPFGYSCSRHRGHSGDRHVACGPRSAVAAWPGTHEPTITDLEVPA